MQSPSGGRMNVLSGPGQSRRVGVLSVQSQGKLSTDVLSRLGSPKRSVPRFRAGWGPPDALSLGSEQARDSGCRSDGLRHACLLGSLLI